MEVDLRRLDRADFAIADIPIATERLLLSYNRLRSFRFDFFFRHCHIFHFDLSHNELTSLKFLRCYRALGFLDISRNRLPLKALLDIQHIAILRINLRDNQFDETMAHAPLFVPTILSQCWIIDGHFITDADRAAHAEFQSTLAFGGILAEAIKPDGHDHPHLSVSQVARFFVGLDEELHEPGVIFTPPRSDAIARLTAQPQLDRLAYLATDFPVELPDGPFVDYFGVAIAIVAKLWIGEPVQTVPHFLCPAYWYRIGDDLKQMEWYELCIVLYQISQRKRSSNEIESGLWRSSRIDKFLRTGKVPILGSDSRMIISALIARSIALSSSELSQESTPDLRAYFKFRKSCGFRVLDPSLESVYQEIIAPLWQPPRTCPVPDDVIELVHPVTSAWMRGRIISAKAGRVYAAVGGVVSHLLASAVFWDGRGFWREVAKRELKVKHAEANELGTFITAADQVGKVATAVELAALGQRFAAPSALVEVRPPPGEVTMIHHNPALRAKESQVDESKMMEGWRTFRGIVEPPLPRPERSVRSARNPRRAQLIQNVVNVVPGRDWGVEPRPRRFNVRVMNTLTGKSRYSWVGEDEIDADDADSLMVMYRQHVANRLRKHGDAPLVTIPRV
jgi:hypothetical protein